MTTIKALRSQRFTAVLLALTLNACQDHQSEHEAPSATDGEAATSCTDLSPAPVSLPGARSVIYRTASGRPLRIHVFEPAPHKKPAPSVLLFFGGGWRTGSVTALEDQARAFASRGYVAGLVDYRIKCRDGTNPLDATEDSQAAYAWWRTNAPTFGADTKRIILAGGSAGGQLALAAAMRAPAGAEPAALVLFNPAVDLVGPAPFYLKPFAWRISPSSLPVEHLPPTIIFHGQADRRVPIGTVQAFCHKASGAGRSCQIVSYRGQGHGFYHSLKVDPNLARSPYADTMAGSFWFLEAQGVSPEPFSGSIARSG